MTSLLVVDVGNTTTRIGTWRDGAVRDVFVKRTAAMLCADDVAAAVAHVSDPQAEVALSSVVPAAQAAWLAWCQAAERAAFVVTGETPSPLVNCYEEPARLGPDRLAAAVAAVRRLGAPVIAVSLGTATVIDAVSPRKKFLGGAVAVGVETGLVALAQMTAALPRVSLTSAVEAIGRNTAACLRSGAVAGAAAMIEGLVARMRSVVGDAPVAVTGGHAELISKHLRLDHQVHPYLTLEGIAIICEHNRGGV